MKNNQRVVYVSVGLILLVLIGVVYAFKGGKGNNTSMQGGTIDEASGKPVAQSHRGYEMEVTSSLEKVKPNVSVVLTYKIKNDKGEVLKQFEIAHEKIMHFIAVRSDLQDFQHLHPTYNKSTGEFSVQITFPNDGPYRLFPDFTPGADNPQKLPVTVFSDVEVGDKTRYKAHSITADTQTKKAYGDYQVAFTVPKAETQEEFTYTILVEKNGQPVTDLEKYLGALGHSVILKEGTLDFIHTHALENTAGGHGQTAQHSSTTTNTSGPAIDFSTTLPEKGLYKIFTQFQHSEKVQTVDYVVRAN